MKCLETNEKVEDPKLATALERFAKIQTLYDKLCEGKQNPEVEALHGEALVKANKNARNWLFSRWESKTGNHWHRPLNDEMKVQLHKMRQALEPILSPKSKNG